MWGKKTDRGGEEGSRVWCVVHCHLMHVGADYFGLIGSGKQFRDVRSVSGQPVECRTDSGLPGSCHFLKNGRILENAAKDNRNTAPDLPK